MLRICAPVELAPLAVFPAAAPSVEQEQGGNGNGLFVGGCQTLYLFVPFGRYDLECFAEQTAELLSSIGPPAQHCVFSLPFLAAIDSPGE